MAKKLKAGLVVERVPLDTINEAEVNPNKHPERNIAAIRTSLEQFGQVEPLVVRLANREVIGDNGRLQTMREMGWTEADVVFVDVDDTQAKAMGLALNRTGQLAEWDFEELANLMRELQEGGINLTDLGWMDYEIEPLLNFNGQAPAATDGEQSGGPAGVDALIDQWSVVVQCQNEDDQRELYERMLKEGRTCRLLTV